MWVIRRGALIAKRKPSATRLPQALTMSAFGIR
jgi:hypothetical protein